MDTTPTTQREQEPPTEASPEKDDFKARLEAMLAKGRPQTGIAPIA